MADGRTKDLSNSTNTQPIEQPQHYAYIYKFRVEQCPLFLQHKCTQHRPFTCFHWHFQNQKRRKPVKRRDGTLNYSADEYCTKYDETTGICPDGDECSLLHRTAGDTERRYHLRYYKTAPCVHETDSRGFCTKNGVHCAFAHGNLDLRNPVYDICEIRMAKDSNMDFDVNGFNILDKERNLLNDDPKWQDTNFVLVSYKTEPCKKPPRLCRQGYACPQYHNSRDRRRSPKKFKYRSTPCPSAKHGEEWGDPSGCDSGDICQYCHTRTEQQFHPEIYKSTKCHDMQINSYCPRGSFCAFSHGDCEANRDNSQYQECGTGFAELLSGALPSSTSQKYNKETSSLADLSDQLVDLLSETTPTFQQIKNTNLEHSNCSSAVTASVPIKTTYGRLRSLETGEFALASSGPTGNSGTSLGGFGLLVQPISKPRSLSVPGTELGSINDCVNRRISFERENDWLPASHSDVFRDHGDGGIGKIPSVYGSNAVGNLLPRIQPSPYFSANSRQSDCVLGWCDEIDDHFKDSSQDYETDQPSLCESIALGVASSGLLSSSAPVNIPRPGEDRYALSLTPSPPHSNVSRIPADGVETVDGPTNSSLFFNRVGSYSNTGIPFHEWGKQHSSPSNGFRGSNSVISDSPLMSSVAILNGGSFHNNELQRLREEAVINQAKMISMEEDLMLVRNACDAWRCKALVAEQQRDEAASKLAALQKEMRVLRAKAGQAQEVQECQ